MKNKTIIIGIISIISIMIIGITLAYSPTGVGGVPSEFGHSGDEIEIIAPNQYMNGGEGKTRINEAIAQGRIGACMNWKSEINSPTTNENLGGIGTTYTNSQEFNYGGNELEAYTGNVGNLCADGDGCEITIIELGENLAANSVISVEKGKLYATSGGNLFGLWAIEWAFKKGNTLTTGFDGALSTKTETVIAGTQRCKLIDLYSPGEASAPLGSGPEFVDLSANNRCIFKVCD